MIEQHPSPTVSEPQSNETPRQPYAPPRLTVHGTIQTLTLGSTVGGGDFSSVDGE
jgi:hypothetical protein